MIKGENIAVLGGTFNPIHNGHLFMADEYNRLKKADITLFIPTNLPPHKSFNTDVSNEDRLTMCKLAIKGKPNYIVSDIEYKLGGKSYSVNTLQYIKSHYKPSSLTFIMGADMFLTFNKWYKPKEILQLANLAIIPRNNTDIKALIDYKNALLMDYQFANIEILKTELLPISSTLVRERIRNGESIEDIVPLSVQQYINLKGIYKEHIK